VQVNGVIRPAQTVAKSNFMATVIKSIGEIYQMTKEELEKLVKDTVSTEVKEAVKTGMEGVKAGWNPNPTGTIDDAAVTKETKDNPWKSKGEFYNAIWRARNLGQGDNRLKFLTVDGKVLGDIDTHILGGLNKPVAPDVAAKTALAGTTDSTGGFLVPEEFRAELLALEQEESIVRSSGAWVIPMASDTLLIPRVNETSRASSLFGGASAKWTQEAATMTESEPTFGQARFTANELTGYTVCSNTLLQDNAVGLSSFLQRVLTEVPAWYEDYAFLNGTGVGEPLGIYNSDCKVSVFRNTSSLLYISDFPNLFARALPKSMGKGKFVMNQAAFPSLVGLSSHNGALAAGSNLVWINQNQGGLANAVPGTILGRPYILTEKAPTLGSANDVAFIDFSYYIIGDRSALTIDASSHVGFTSNVTYWRFVKRVTGGPWLASALTPRNGSTLSPFVSLASTTS
jgi:HK97 family phage major capsid protein